ncbi:hypothetical protein DRB96_17950 [Streptomyces sp. ICC1]|uniref:hypothetical protein n=1 Tax=Streptomyces sp. ICC4 TaxID=2099584 RepID=UPI000DC7B67D|nr:hypothetical protein [Streptomyces sp. ICC4]AWZ13868.1 hypothetical protein DRB96_17950 [Streptomyces sp. ICC1]
MTGPARTQPPDRLPPVHVLLPDGVEHRTGIWIVNQIQRLDWLEPAQLAALADLGVDRAR